MSAPVFQAIGSLASGVSGISVSWPSHATDDIGILVVESANEAITTPTGWTLITGPVGTGPAAGTASTTLCLYWKRAASGAEGAVSVADPGDHVGGLIITFRGALTSGSPIDASAGSNATGAPASISITTITTTVADCLVVAVASHNADNTSAHFSSWTNANLSGITEHYDSGHTDGNGGGFGIASGTKSSAGSVGATTANTTGLNRSAFGQFALKPSAIVNTDLNSAGVGASSLVSGATAKSDVASAGVAATSLAGQSVFTGVLDSTGAGATSFVGGIVAEGTFASTGVAASSLVASAPTTSVLNAAGAADSALVGEDGNAGEATLDANGAASASFATSAVSRTELGVSGSATMGVVASSAFQTELGAAGAASVLHQASAEFASVLNADGVATTSLEGIDSAAGGAVVEADFNASGASAVSFESQPQNYIVTYDSGGIVIPTKPQGRVVEASMVSSSRAQAAWSVRYAQAAVLSVASQADALVTSCSPVNAVVNAAGKTDAKLVGLTYDPGLAEFLEMMLEAA